MNISVDRLIWNYVNRGLMEDTSDEDLFREVHSEEYLTEVKEALGIEYQYHVFFQEISVRLISSVPDNSSCQ